MKLINWFKLMIDSDSSVSSKRFCGVLGWIVSICIIIYCTVNVVQAPTIMEFFLMSVVGLLGVDSVTNIWKDTKNNETKTKDSDQV